MSIPLLNTFCRLAATGANKVPRPSRYSITTATGSKRSSADSDSLLCHVGLWRTSRLEFGESMGTNIARWGLFRQYTVVTPHPPLLRSPFSRRRRLVRCRAFLKTKLRMSAFDNFHRMSKYKNVYEIWLMGLESLLQWEKVAAVG